MANQTTQTKLFQLPINPGEEQLAQQAKKKIGTYKITHDKRSLLEALVELLESAEKVEAILK